MNSNFPQPLAIVGMGCRLPGGDGLDSFWQMLIEGRSAVGELPESRLDRRLYYDPKRGVVGRTYSTLGALVSDRPLSPNRYRLTEAEVRHADYAHLELLGVAAEACRHAGYDPLAIPTPRAGAFIGHTCGASLAGELSYASMVGETAGWLREIDKFVEFTRPNTEEWINKLTEAVRAGLPNYASHGNPLLSAHCVARLVSRAFGLDGPYMAFDAACASSLMALATGAAALHSGRIDMALIGGASYLHQDSLILFSRAQSLGVTGSRPFDADADGLVTAEGYVVVLVKTLERALSDGDRIHAVISGIGVSSDGKGKSLWVPLRRGQVEAVHRAYGDRVDAAHLQYLEAHATSTQVGDATEIAALAEALSGQFPEGKRIPVGSVKANIGHTLEVAGLAGLVKTVLAMQNRQIPPAINLNRLNPAIDWDHIPFFVPTKPVQWPDPEPGWPCRAGVNAFGIGGLNVHVALEEFVPAVHSSAAVSAPARSAGAAPSAVPRLTQEPIAVIGIGTILPGALNLKAFQELLASGRDPKCEVPKDRWDAHLAYDPELRRPGTTYAVRGGFITDYAYDWRKHKVPPKQVAQADPLQFMLLDAVDQAIAHAGYREKPFDRKRTGVAVGTIFDGEFQAQLQMGLCLPKFIDTLKRILTLQGGSTPHLDEIAQKYTQLLLKRMPALLDETGSFTSSTLASRITKTFDLMGGATAIDAGGASGLLALQACGDALAVGRNDVMICAAGQRAMALSWFEAASRDGILSRSGDVLPLDRKADSLWG